MTETVRPFVTVVSGAPRSGTSMMMRMLEAGGIGPVADAVREADRDNPLGYYEFEPVKRLAEDATWMPRAEGRAVKMVYALLRHLPPTHAYRVLFMRRDLAEVVKSQNSMLARLGRPPRKISDERTIEMFRAHLVETERWLEQAAHCTWMRVDYNALVVDPEPRAAEIAAFLGGGLDTAAMAAVVDPALYRNRG